MFLDYLNCVYLTLICYGFILIFCVHIYRLHKIQELLEITITYSSLGQSHIEGIDTLHNRFQLIVTGMRKKPYDVLEHRKTDFDADFEEFKRQTADIKVRNVNN